MTWKIGGKDFRGLVEGKFGERKTKINGGGGLSLNHCDLTVYTLTVHCTVYTRLYNRFNTVDVFK